MRRTMTVLVLSLLSLAAAAFAALRTRVAPGPIGDKPPAVVTRAGALSISAQLDRAFVSERGGGEAYLEVDVIADGKREQGARVPVNAVLVLDRSGSMTGQKLARAKEAARELLTQLNGDDRFALIDFGSDARVLVPSMAATPANTESALALVDGLRAYGGTNLSAALDLAAPQLASGRGTGRTDKVFLASDGQANEGISTRRGLLEVARRDFGTIATVSTFGVGDDYDEDMMTSLAAQSGGMTHFIKNANEIVPAFRAELSRATSAVARNVRLIVTPAPGTRVQQVIGYESDGGWVRLPDFAAGERRRVLVKLELGAGKGQAELAKVQLSFLGDDGATRECLAAAAATFTADEKQASRRDAPAAFNGARAEMNALAAKTSELFARGQRAAAAVEVGKMRGLASMAAAAPAAKPADRAQVLDEMKQYEAMFDQTVPVGLGASSGAPSKAAKQAAFDNVRSSY